MDDEEQQPAEEAQPEPEQPIEQPVEAAPQPEPIAEAQPEPLSFPALIATLLQEHADVKQRLAQVEAVAHSGHSLPEETVTAIVERVLGELASRVRSAIG